VRGASRREGYQAALPAKGVGSAFNFPRDVWRRRAPAVAWRQCRVPVVFCVCVTSGCQLSCTFGELEVWKSRCWACEPPCPPSVLMRLAGRSRSGS